MRNFIKIVFIMLSFVLFSLTKVCAQEAPMIIETHHPDFVVKVKRCVVGGRNLILDLTCTNIGIDDLNKFAVAPILIEVIDDEGNSYMGNIGAKVANQQNYTYQHNAFTDMTMATKLLPEIPVKVSINIPNFSKEATSIALIEIGIACPKWNYRVNLRNFTQRLTIRNIPVTRK